MVLEILPQLLFVHVMLCCLTFLFSLLHAGIYRTLDITTFSNAYNNQISNYDSSYLYFNQSVDHFNTSCTDTFQQRYLFTDKYYSGSHMMFVYIVGEQTMPITVLSNNWVNGLF